MKREELVHSDIIKMMIFLKINQLKREQLDSLTYTHIVKVLFYIIWDCKLPNTIHEAVDDIMKLEAKDVVTALHTLAMIEGSKMSLDKIDSILGGNENE